MNQVNRENSPEQLVADRTPEPQIALVKVYDVRLALVGNGWAAVALDVHRSRWFGLGSHVAHSARDWRNFLPLASISGLPVARSSPNWIGRLKPAQIADLIEAANADEQDKLLEQVVFEELEEDSQAHVLKSLSDDFNLLSLPVVDEDGIRLGVVTVDDALEAALPAQWVSR